MLCFFFLDVHTNKIPVQLHIVSHTIQRNGAQESVLFTQMANLAALCSAALWCRAGRINDGCFGECVGETSAEE